VELEPTIDRAIHYIISYRYMRSASRYSETETFLRTGERTIAIVVMI